MILSCSKIISNCRKSFSCSFVSFVVIFFCFICLLAVLPSGDAVPDAEGEPRRDEETEELADSHDAGHLPERSTEQTVTDDDDVAQDGERRA